MKGRKTQQPAEHIREEPRGKKKKKNQKQEREKNLDRSAWVAHGARGLTWPGSRTARAARPSLGRARRARPGLAWAGLRAAWPRFFSLCFFFLFFFSLWVLLDLGSSLAFISFINRVLKTRFLYVHVEKYATSKMIRS